MAIPLFVDRITDGIASLIHGDGEFGAVLPAEALPAGAKEGDWLNASFEIDPDKRENMKREINSLMDELEKRSGGWSV